MFILGQTISSAVIEGDPESSQSQIVISSDNEHQGNYKLVMVTAANDSGTEYMFSQSGKGIQLYRQVRGNAGKKSVVCILFDILWNQEIKTAVCVKNFSEDLICIILERFF